MNLTEALEVLTENAEREDRAAFNHLDGRLNQIMRELRKRARSEPGSKIAIERMIKWAGEADLSLSKIQGRLANIESFVKQFHI